MDDVPFDLTTTWTDDLRERPLDPAAVAAAVEWLAGRTDDVARRRSQRGALLLLLDRAGEAAADLDRALELLGDAWTPARAVAEVRRAHADHRLERFDAAEARLLGVLAAAIDEPALGPWTSFAWQHLGKALLDAGRPHEAEAALLAAHALRSGGAGDDPALRASTDRALAVARARTAQGAGPELAAVDLGRIAYDEALALQRRLAAARARGEGRDLLLLCEHDEVVTTGRKAQRPDRDQEAELAAAAAAGLDVVEVERGGSATYHGPGQLVGYAILRLAEGERDLHRVLRALEEAVIEGLWATARLPATTRDGLTGVWVGPKKLCSIGIACRSWVTFHGLAVNLETDLSRFRLFRPCDLDANVMASVASLGAPVDRAALAARVHASLARRLGRAPVAGGPADL